MAAILWATVGLKALRVLVKYFKERRENVFEMPALMDPQNGGIFEDEFASLLGKSLKETQEIIEELRSRNLVVVRERARTVMVPTVWFSGKGLTEAEKEEEEEEVPETSPVVRHVSPRQPEKSPSKK